MEDNLDLRVASFNASLNRFNAGDLITDLSTPDDSQAQSVAEIIQRVNPDVVLVNEFDFDAAGEAAALFQENYLGVSQNGQTPVDYPFVYVAPSNTGVPSGIDFNGDGDVGGPNDAFGFGFFPGQFSFAIFSKHEILEEDIRTFQEFRWIDMPISLLSDPTGQVLFDAENPEGSFFSEEAAQAFRLSSKNHVDLPVQVGDEVVHILAAHPTPPVFDGVEDLNGKRNFDEIRFWADYVDPIAGDYIYDDAGNTGGLEAGSRFVIVGDYNSDPFDGDSIPGAAQQFLENDLIDGSTTDASITPASEGGPDQAAAQGGANADHIGNPAFDTADFGFAGAGNPDASPGNLRVDYALPSVYGLDLTDQAVFWPASGDPLFDLAAFPTSDHRLVWVDVALEEALNVSTPVAPETSTVAGLDFLGEVTFPTGASFAGATVGGLSGLVYSEALETFVALSDDRGGFGEPSRVFFLDIDLSDGTLDNGDVLLEGTAPLRDAEGAPIGADTLLDPEGIALLPDGSILVASERNATGNTPELLLFDQTFTEIGAIAVDDRFVGAADGTAGVVTNLAFESATTAPSGGFFAVATENALAQDGPVATPESGSAARITVYETGSNSVAGEFAYVTDAAVASEPEGGFTTNGLVEMLAVDDDGTFLALERSFATGVGNGIRLYEVSTAGATDISEVDALTTEIVDGALTIDGVRPVAKELVFDLAELGLTLDNVEALAFGPTLEDGRQTILLASDNNFSDTQFTQFLAFAIDLDTVPTLESVASGEVGTSSAVLWADRTEISEFAGPGAEEITFEVATDAGFANIVATVAATSPSSLVPAETRVEGLEAGTRYHYRATAADGSALTGTFETPAESGFNGLNFGVTGDWRGELAPYSAVSNVAELELDFFLLLGDTIYADFDSPALPVDQAVTLEDFRIKHDEVYSERGGENFWADIRASTPVFATIDDHEVTNDFAGGATIGETAEDEFRTLFPEDPAEAFVNDSQLYENGLQAFFDYNPLEATVFDAPNDPVSDGEPNLFRSQRYGQDAQFIVLDQRSFRDEQLTGATGGTPEQIGAFIGESLLRTDRTLLGETQFDLLKEELLAAEEAGVTWKFVSSPEPIQNIGLFNADSYEGYAAERAELLQFIEDNDIDNVVFVAADVHATFVNNLTYQDPADPLGPLGPQIASSAFEITTGSVAFDAPTGEVIVDVAAATGLLSPEEIAFLQTLPAAPDTDDIVDDQDDFLTQALNDLALIPTGLDPLGLDDNLPQAEGLIDAELIQGDYVSAFTFGWTEFDVDAETQALTVTTYGILPYTEEEVLADPTVALDREPFIVSQFVVQAQETGISDGDDLQRGTDGDDAVDGLGGDDVLTGLDGSDSLAGGEGDDRLFGNNGDDSLFGGAGGDALFLGTGDDFGAGGAGDDRIQGFDGADVIDAGAGADLVLAGAGEDSVTGGEGDDRLQGNAGDDTIDGGAGDDVLFGSFDNDLLQGGEGNDILRGGSGDDAANGGAGDDRMQGSDGDDSFDGDAGDDVILGSAGNDTLDGGEGDDAISGGDGDDVMIGGLGNDRLVAGVGTDSLDGGEGADRLFLVDGADSVVFTDGDVVFGFDAAEDTLSVTTATAFEDLTIAEVGGNTAIRAGDARIVLVDVAEADLTADSFAFV